MKIDLKLTLELHAKWLRDEEDGERADLTYANLRGANLRGANLRGADLTYADLTYADLTYANLRGADLTDANLTYADLTYANLSGADLTDANLTYADLTYANLSGADLTYADLDFASWPLWCGSFRAKANMRLVAQISKHLAMLDVSGCCGGIREAHAAFCRTGLAHLFDEFRADLGGKSTPVEGE